MTIEPFDLRQPTSYDLVVDRLTHWYTTSREWIKKAVLMDGLYVFNNPWAIQSMEKHTSYCAMMRLGMPIPETWIVPPKDYESKPDLADHAGALRPAVRPRRGRPRGRLPAVRQALRRRRLGRRQPGRRRARRCTGAYDESGTYLLHLQRAVEPHDLFVRCIGFGPQTRLVRYDPSAPLHDRYTMDDGGVPDDQRQTLVDTTLTINSFFGWEFNSCEALRQGDDLAPDRLRQRLPRLAGDVAALPLPVARAANLRWSIFCAATKRPMPVNLDWAPYFEIADTDARTPRSWRPTRRSPASASRPTSSRSSAPPTSPTSTRSCGSSSATDVAYDAVRQKVAALFPAHEVERLHRPVLGAHPALAPDAAAASGR